MYNKLVLLFVLALFLCSAISIGHAEGPKLWIANDGGLFGKEYITNGKIKIHQGFFLGFHIEELVKDNPNAIALVEKHFKYNTFANLALWLGFVPALSVTFFELGIQNFKDGQFSSLAALVFALLTNYFFTESRHYMYEAINLYNGVTKPNGVENPTTSIMQRYPQRYPLMSNVNTIAVSFSF